MVEGKYEFSDGMKFEEPSKWDFCTYKDRRFYHEIINNIKNPNINEFNKRLFKEIPEGTYGNLISFQNISAFILFILLI